MTEPFVLVSYLAVYGLIIGYAVYLVRATARLRRR